MNKQNKLITALALPIDLKYLKHGDATSKMPYYTQRLNFCSINNSLLIV